MTAHGDRGARDLSHLRGLGFVGGLSVVLGLRVSLFLLYTSCTPHNGKPTVSDPVEDFDLHLQC